MSGWIDGSWNTLTLGGFVLPGIVRKLNFTPKRSIKMVKKPKTDTPQTKDEGFDGTDIDCELEIFRSAQVEELTPILATLSPRQPGSLKTPLAISHPLATIAGVTTVYIEQYTIGLPEGGRWKIPIKMSQWFPEEVKGTNQGKQPPKDGGPFGDPATPPPDPANKGANFP